MRLETVETGMVFIVRVVEWRAVQKIDLKMMHVVRHRGVPLERIASIIYLAGGC
jgi:hypothetical protein